MNEDVFDFVIARPWDKSETSAYNLCIYAMGNEVQRGDLEFAIELLDSVNFLEKGKQYTIYRVAFEKVEVK